MHTREESEMKLRAFGFGEWDVCAGRMLITHDDEANEGEEKSREIFLICALNFFLLSLSHSASAQSHDELIGGEKSSCVKKSEAFN